MPPFSKRLDERHHPFLDEIDMFYWRSRVRERLFMGKRNRFKLRSKDVEILRRQRREQPICNRGCGGHVLLRKIRARARASPSRPRP